MTQIVKVLKDRNFAEHNSVRNALAHHESGNKMLNRSSLATMRSDDKRIETPFIAEVVKNRGIGVHIVHVIGIGRVLVLCPLIRSWYVSIKQWIFRLGFIINGVKSNDIPRKILSFAFWDLNLLCRHLFP